VIDYDGAQHTFYKPVEFDDPRLLMSRRTRALPSACTAPTHKLLIDYDF
jgi:hypothetical protein